MTRRQTRIEQLVTLINQAGDTWDNEADGKATATKPRHASTACTSVFALNRT